MFCVCNVNPNYRLLISTMVLFILIFKTAIKFPLQLLFKFKSVSKTQGVGKRKIKFQLKQEFLKELE